MNRCPITYRECGERMYSVEGLALFSKKLGDELILPFSTAEQLSLAGEYAAKLSIGGVQPKLSLRLNVTQHRFEVVERGGTYIMKPQHPFYSQLPENEDVTMRPASRAGIDVPFHALIYGSDGLLSYVIRRFDRHGRGKKYAVEDFAQLTHQGRDAKYDSSMEKLIPVLDMHASFPLLEKVKLFRLVLFCFLVGNEDMHLKNFSLLRHRDKVELSPAYDLVSSTLVMQSRDELALPLAGKRSKITSDLLCDYYGRDRLGLRPSVIDDEMQALYKASQAWENLIQASFLTPDMQEKYLELVAERKRRLFTS